MLDWLMQAIPWAFVALLAYDHWKLRKTFFQYAKNLGTALENEFETNRRWREARTQDVTQMQVHISKLMRMTSGVTREQVERMIANEIDKLGKYY